MYLIVVLGLCSVYPWYFQLNYYSRDCCPGVHEPLKGCAKVLPGVLKQKYGVDTSTFTILAVTKCVL